MGVVRGDGQGSLLVYMSGNVCEVRDSDGLLYKDQMGL